MNLTCFGDLKKTLSTRNEKVTDALAAYHREAERIRNRYAPEIAVQELERAKLGAREKVVTANKEAHSAAQQSLDVLRADLEGSAMAAADPALLARLQTAKAFDMKLGRLELEGMAKAASGDSVATGALAAVAKQSGYLLDFTPLSALEGDLDKLDRAFPEDCSMYAGEYVQEGLDCLPDYTYHGVFYGRPTAVQIATAGASAASTMKDLNEIHDRWMNRKEYTLTPIVMPI